MSAETVYGHFAINYNKSRIRPSELTVFFSVLFFFLWEMQPNTQCKDIGTIFHKPRSGYFIFYNTKEKKKQNHKTFKKKKIKKQISKIIRKQNQKSCGLQKETI